MKANEFLPEGLRDPKDNRYHPVGTKQKDGRTVPNCVPNANEGVGGGIGDKIRELCQKIYDQGDDEFEYFYNDSPIFAQYWDEYEGDLDSIIAEADPQDLQVILDELESYIEQAGLAEGIGKDMAKLGGIAAIGIGAGLAGNYYDQQQPRVEVGGQKAYLVQNPGWGRVPDNAMTLQGNDGKTYTVWASKGKGTTQYYATPADNVKEGVAEGFSDVVKGIKRKVAGKEDPKEVEHMYGRIARSAIKHKTPDQAEKDIKRWEKVNKVVNKEDVQEDSDPCWDNYKQIGMKTKNGKQVPNCVPKEGVAEGDTSMDHKNAGEYDYEGDMAKDDLETIVRAAQQLTGMISDNENMPEWVQSKINKAADYVDTAADYMASNQDEPMDEAQQEKIGGRHSPEDFDAMVGRLKKLAGAGPMKTVYDPNTRRYKNVPTAVQPGDKK